MKMWVGREVAEEVTDKIERQLYDGIPTKKIFRMIFTYLKNYKPTVKNRRDLKTVINLLRSKPDWELFIQFLLSEYGYEVCLTRLSVVDV